MTRIIIIKISFNSMQRTRVSANKYNVDTCVDERDAAQKRNAALAIASLFMDEKSQRDLREVNRGVRDAMQKIQTVPYQNKTAFAAASSGLFHDPYLQSYLQAAWNYYCAIMKSDSMKPAVLYKLRDKEFNETFEDKFWSFRDGENVEQNGRQYKPEKFCDDDHCWAFNLVWMLANIHKGRAFVIFSELTEKNLHRAFQPEYHSAFARELAAAMMAGYLLTLNNSNDLELTPNRKTCRTQFHALIFMKDDEITIECERLRMQAHILVDMNTNLFSSSHHEYDGLGNTSTLARRYR